MLLPDPCNLSVDCSNLGLDPPGLFQMGLHAVGRRAVLLGDGDCLEPGIEESPLNLLAVLVRHHDDDHVAGYPTREELLIRDADIDIMGNVSGKNGKSCIPAIELQVQRNCNKWFKFSRALLVLFLPCIQS